MSLWLLVAATGAFLFCYLLAFAFWQRVFAGFDVWFPYSGERVDWSRSCKGGSAPKPPKEQKIEKPDPIVIPPPPKPPPPPPAPPPPPTETVADVETAKLDQRRQEAKRRGMAKTLLAGESGGYSPEGRKTLLG
jgi:hypothetical protein